MNEGQPKFLSVAETAARLEVTRARVNQLIDAGALRAQKIGRAYAIAESDLAEFEKLDRQAGRPPKNKNQNTNNPDEKQSYLSYGESAAGETGKMSTEKDFEIAEWRPTESELKGE